MRWPMTWLWLMVALVVAIGAAEARNTPGTRFSAQIVASGGDPIFYPTEQQLQGWVNDGINAASGEIGLLAVPGIDAWTARFPSGVPCWTGRVQAVIAVTPQVVATAAGWSAAWEPDIWEQISADQNAVAAAMAGSFGANSWARDLPFLIAMRRDNLWDPIDARSAVWAYEQWRNVNLSHRGVLLNVADDSPGRMHPTQKWAGNYVMAWSMYDSALSDPGSIMLVEGNLMRIQRLGPQPWIAEQVDVPSSGWRLVVGRPDEYAYIDF